MSMRRSQMKKLMDNILTKAGACVKERYPYNGDMKEMFQRREKSEVEPLPTKNRQVMCRTYLLYGST